MNQQQPSSQAERIIRKFGSIGVMARQLGMPRSSVQRWKESGSIHERYWEKILITALRNNVPVEPYDFVAHLSAVLARHAAAAVSVDQKSVNCKENCEA